MIATETLPGDITGSYPQILVKENGKIWKTIRRPAHVYIALSVENLYREEHGGNQWRRLQRYAELVCMTLSSAQCHVASDTYHYISHSQILQNLHGLMCIPSRGSRLRFIVNVVVNPIYFLTLNGWILELESGISYVQFIDRKFGI